MDWNADPGDWWINFLELLSTLSPRFELSWGFSHISMPAKISSFNPLEGANYSLPLVELKRLLNSWILDWDCFKLLEQDLNCAFHPFRYVFLINMTWRHFILPWGWARWVAMVFTVYSFSIHYESLNSFNCFGIRASVISASHLEFF